jgi:fibronectin type 3 domain-containing protein
VALVLTVLLGVTGVSFVLAAPALLGSGPAAVAEEPIVVAAAGDVACAPGGSPSSTGCRQSDTADVVAGMNPAAVLALGDLQYDHGTAAEFAAYDASWGRFKPITHPVPGNHEYDTSGAAGYYGYFGSAAGDPARGYYSWDIGAWHMIALNSECGAAGGCDPGTPQETWLRADLAANAGKCTLAYWHHPLFSSSHDSSDSRPFWDALYAGGADLVLNGHSHNYEHFAPQTPSGSASSAGLRQFVVGTGGVYFHSLGSLQPNTVARQDHTFGVLKLSLYGSRYDWQFMPVAGSTWTDAGSANCHNSSTPPPTAPAAPTGLTVTSASASQVGLSWTASTGPNVAGYRVYRNGSATPLNGSLVPTTGYTDGTVAGGTTYSYTVTAVNTSGVESTRSAAVSATTPSAPPGSGVLDVPVRAGADDAEEAASGAVDLSSSDLELVTDGTAQTVGMRFTGVAVPAGATISNAYVQFQVDETPSAATNLTVAGQAVDNPPAFTTAVRNVSSRPRTTAAVGWTPAAWPTIGARGPDQRTPNLASVVQEIVSRQGWAGGNALALIVTGSGRRTAEAFESGAGLAPVLHIEYSSSSQGPTNSAPVVSAGADAAVTRPDAASLAGSVTDDGLPNPPAQVTATWTKVSGPGTVTFGNAGAASTTATFSSAGSYVLRLTGNDGQLTAADDVVVAASDTGALTLDVPVRAGADDAEERTSSGAVTLTSGDLNLGQDGANAQMSGLRFTGVALPKGVTIITAWLQFQVDEASTTTASLTVAGAAADDAGPFTTTARNVSTRPRTAASVPWTPATWPTAGARAAEQRTPNLAAVLQEIVDRPGWSGGNALVLVVSGSGERTAESCDGGAAKAPVLHVEYTG